ncbi:molecular chaperone [Shewanella sp. 10N.286.52.A9]|uniref:TorD/DmsD family molecular chaperone n=1 Tax=Shewanella sp. 10N.286.52.A9 TaxID=3229711 RepID=UPI00354D4677
MKQIDFENTEAVCRVLSGMLFNTPSEDFYQQMSKEILLSWPTITTPIDEITCSMQRSLSEQSFTTLRDDFYQLFIGPGVKKAYPWGSVYTDKDNLVNGASCVAFEQFCMQHGMTINLPKKQPLDHIGLILAVLANLLKEQKPDLALIVIKQHLMPWLPQFLNCVDTNAETDFYRGVAKLVAITIDDLILLNDMSAE